MELAATAIYKLGVRVKSRLFVNRPTENGRLSAKRGRAVALRVEPLVCGAIVSPLTGGWRASSSVAGKTTFSVAGWTGMNVVNGMDAPTRSGIDVPKWKRYFNHLKREERAS